MILLPWCCFVGGLIWLLYLPNVKVEKYELKIARGTSFQTLFDQLKRDGVLSQTTSFEMMAGIMGYKKMRCLRADFY